MSPQHACQCPSFRLPSLHPHQLALAAASPFSALLDAPSVPAVAYCCESRESAPASPAVADSAARAAALSVASEAARRMQAARMK